MPQIYNRLKGYPRGAVYVGRGSQFGNPFVMKDEKDRDKVCDQFEQLASNDPAFVKLVKDQLKGMDLVCFCAPKRCHAETLLRIANE